MLNTVLHSWHKQAGARMVDFAGWEMPIQYSSIVEEHHAVRKSAGLFDIAHMGRIWFKGPGGIPFLDHILTNHVEKMKPGQVRYSLVCREDGGILDDVLIYRFGDRYLLVVNGANREKIVDWIETQRGDYEFDYHDETLSSFMLAIQGPKAQEILAPLVNFDLNELKYYTVRDGHVLNHQAVISRTGYTGEDGFEVIVDLEHGVEVWEKLIEAGGTDICPCGLGCRDTLRLEAAMPLYGHEMDESVDPFTAGLSFGVKMSKENFLGKSALAAIQQKGNLPTRIGIELGGRRIAREGAKLMQGDIEVGHVTSGTFSPTLEKSIAMAYASEGFTSPGQSVDVDIRGKRESATVVQLPFYKRS